MRLQYHRTIIAAGLLGFLVCMALIFGGCASSALGRSLNAGVVTSAALDLHSTRQAMESGRGREGNPVLGQALGQQVAVKSLGVGAVLGLAQLAEAKGKTVTAHLARAVVTAAWSVVAYRNYQIARR